MVRSIALARWLFVGVVGVATSFIVVTALGRMRGVSIENNLHAIVDEAMPAVQHLSRARTALRRLDADVQRAANGDREARARLDQESAAINEALASHTAVHSFPDEAALREDANASLRTIQGALATLGADPLGPFDPAFAVAEREGSLRLDAALERLVERDAAHSMELAAAVQARRHATQHIVTVLDTCTFALAIFAAALAAILLRRTMASLEEATHEAHERATKLEEKTLELDQFAGRVAHDVLGPLSATVLALDFVQRKYADDERVCAVVKRGLAGVTRSRRLVDGLLEFARAGAKPEHDATCGLDEVVEDVVVGARGDVVAAKVDLTVEPFAPLAVGCSPGVLTSIVSNLVRNAVKHMGEALTRKVVVRVVARGPRCRVMVDDTGPGVPDGMERAIFEPFVRGGSATPGVGLGLATVKRLARAHGGDAGCERRAVGMTFWVDLPIAESVSVTTRATGTVAARDLSA